MRSFVLVLFAAFFVDSITLEPVSGLPTRAYQTARSSTYLQLPKGNVIPFNFDPLIQPHILIRARIDSGPAALFLLDTGSPYSIAIDKSMSEKLRLHFASGRKAESRSQMTEVQANRLTILGIDRKNDVEVDKIGPVYVADIPLLRALAERNPIAGIIGIQILARNTIRFDLTQRRLQIITKQHAKVVNSGSAVLPMKTLPGDPRFYIDVSTSGNRKAEVLLDTGAESTSLPLSEIDSVSPIPSVPVGSATLKGLYILPKLLLPSIGLATFTEPRCPVIGGLRQNKTIIGLRLLSRFIVTMDFPHKTLVLERPPDYKARIKVRGWTGVLVAKKNEGFYVEDIMSRSPALSTALSRGDWIASIDGHKVTGLSLRAVQIVLQGFANTKANLEVVKPDGKLIKISLDRLDEFSAQKLPLSGVVLEKLPETPLELIAMRHDSPALKAGLQPGDQIVEFNGIPTPDITLDVLSHEYRKSDVVWKIVRNGETRTVHLTALP